MEQGANPGDGDMPAEIDFSKRVTEGLNQRGARVNLPFYLDDQVQATLTALAGVKGIDRAALVNILLLKDIELIVQNFGLTER
jgi:hypothetical protein